MPSRKSWAIALGCPRFSVQLDRPRLIRKSASCHINPWWSGRTTRRRSVRQADPRCPTPRAQVVRQSLYPAASLDDLESSPTRTSPIRAAAGTRHRRDDRRPDHFPSLVVLTNSDFPPPSIPPHFDDLTLTSERLDRRHLGLRLPGPVRQTADTLKHPFGHLPAGEHHGPT